MCLYLLNLYNWGSLLQPHRPPLDPTFAGDFQTVSRGQVLVFFNGHRTTMNLVEEKQSRPTPLGLKNAHSNSSSMLEALLVFQHLLQVQLTAVL